MTEQAKQDSGADLARVENTYTWPGWDKNWGKAPMIKVHLERPMSRPSDAEHLREELQNLAIAAKQPNAHALRAQLQGWSGKDMYLSLGEDNKAVKPNEANNFLDEYSIKPPVMRHNPDAWYRYPTKNAKSFESHLSYGWTNEVDGKTQFPIQLKQDYEPTAIASPEQNLLLVMAAGKELNQFYELRFKANEKDSPLTSSEKDELIKTSLMHAQLAKDNSNNLEVVNASMQSAVQGYSAMDTNYFDAAARLTSNQNGLLVLTDKSEMEHNFELRELGIASQLHPLKPENVTDNLEKQKELEGRNISEILKHTPLLSTTFREEKDASGKIFEGIRGSNLTPKQKVQLVLQRILELQPEQRDSKLIETTIEFANQSHLKIVEGQNGALEVVSNIAEHVQKNHFPTEELLK